MKTIILLWTLICSNCFGAPFLNSESGPGNGTDFVKVLFANAREEAITILSDLTVESIDYLQMSEYFKEWLKEDVQGSSRFVKLKFYAKTFKFHFQKEPCPDENSICFYQNKEPLVVVSLDENQNTTEKQAVAMILHEVGHFTGEEDHLFLDRFASELIANSREPFVIISEENKRYVSNIFAAANNCEKGIGDQVENLKEVIKLKLFKRCLERDLSCSSQSIVYSFSSRLAELGINFNSASVCRGTGLLKARRP